MGDLRESQGRRDAVSYKHLRDFVMRKVERDEFYRMSITHDKDAAYYELDIYVSREFSLSEIPRDAINELLDRPKLHAQCVLVIVWIPSEHRTQELGSYVYSIIFREGRGAYWSHSAVNIDELDPASHYLVESPPNIIAQFWDYQNYHAKALTVPTSIFEMG